MSILIQTELQKIIKSRVSIACLLVLLVTMLSTIFAEYQDVAAYRANEAYRQEVMSWQERERTLVTYATQSLNEDDWYDDLQREQIRRRIAIAEYRLENNIPKDVYKNVWWFFNDNAFNNVSTLLIVLVMIIGSANIAGEYNGHTIRQVLLLPYKRWKILLSKLCAVAISGFALFGLVFAMGVLSGFLLHGTNGLSAQVVLYFGSELTILNMSVYSLLVVLLKAIEIVFYTSLMLLLCVLTKNVAAATVLSGSLVVFSVPVGNFLASYYQSLYALPLLNVDFRKFLDFGTTMPQIEAGWGNVVTQGITPYFAAGNILGAMLVFVAVSFIVFAKQDV